MPKRLTKEEIEKRISENFKQNVILKSEYINRRTEVTLKCLDCGHEWRALPASFLYKDYNHQCPNCSQVGQEFECANCGKKVYRSLSRIARNQSGLFYCSRECGNIHKNQLRLEAGEWDESQNYRLKAFQQFEHKCAICGWAEDERVLEVHHIDENRNNNNIDNLCILCPTCHRKISLHLYKLTEDFQLIEK